MKNILLISILLTLHVSAQNLEQILESLATTNKYKSIIQKSNSDIAVGELYGTNESASLGASVSHADSIAAGEEDGIEYSIGISQDIVNPFSASSLNKGVREGTNAIKQETKHTLHIIELDVVLAYHNACVSKEMQEKSLSLYKEQSQRYAQFEKAYELGEVSKKDLLFNKLDLTKLHQNVSAYEREYLAELTALQVLVDNININNISCKDLFEPTKQIVLKPIEENGEIQALEYKKNSANALYRVHDSAISSIGYELVYEKELDTKRYTFGISIPLDGLSAQKEKLKADQFALASSYTYEKDSLQSQIENYSKLSVKKLGVLHDEFRLLEREILPLNEELISLSKSALLEGEGDVMEYLDSTRSYALNAIEMLEIKKLYYDELFELYKIADIEYGEKICKN